MMDDFEDEMQWLLDEGFVAKSSENGEISYCLTEKGIGFAQAMEEQTP